MQILIVEDERALSDAIAQLLKDQHYEVDCVYDGRSGLDYARSGQYDLIILDVMLPQMDGFDVVKTLRREKISTPVLILTAREATQDKITGLDCGADDYMTKPFEAPELLARVRALTRRKGEMVIDTLTFGDLTLDLSSHDLACGEQSVHLSKREFDVLQMLMKGTNRIVSKQDLLTRVWGTDADASENSVEAYVSFLRKKIRHLKSKVEITTLRMLGYRLEVME